MIYKINPAVDYNYTIEKLNHSKFVIKHQVRLNKSNQVFMPTNERRFNKTLGSSIRDSQLSPTSPSKLEVTVCAVLNFANLLLQ